MTKEKPAKPKPKTKKWHDKFIFKVYDLAKSNATENQIAKALGMTVPSLRHQIKRLPLLKLAIDLGHATLPAEKSQDDFRSYVYASLPQHLQELWNEINQSEDLENGVLQVESVLKDKGKMTRQHLFLYALVHCSFNESEACRMVSVTTTCLTDWKADPDFAELMQQMHVHKKNFFEGCLVRLAGAGDSAATIFANKTLNKDRYGESPLNVRIKGKMGVQHSGSVENIVRIVPDELPLEMRKQLLAYIREKKVQEEAVAKGTQLAIPDKKSEGKSES